MLERFPVDLLERRSIPKKFLAAIFGELRPVVCMLDGFVVVLMMMPPWHRYARPYSRVGCCRGCVVGYLVSYSMMRMLAVRSACWWTGLSP
jgi:hypothetical protein